MDQAPSAIPVIPTTSKSKSKTPLIIIFVIFLLLILSIAAALILFRVLPGRGSSLSNSLNISPDILFLTSPVYSFDGVIDKTGTDSITVSKQVSINSIAMEAGNPALANPEIRKITYTFSITPETRLDKISSFMPTFIPPSTPSATPQITLTDFKSGQSVSVISKEDLRTVTSGKTVAVSITKSAGTVTASGIISELTSNLLTLKAGPPSLPEPMDIKISINSQTEIISGSGTTQKKASISDLKQGTLVTIYTEDDMVSTPNPVAKGISLMNQPQASTSANLR